MGEAQQKNWGTLIFYLLGIYLCILFKRWSPGNDSVIWVRALRGQSDLGIAIITCLIITPINISININIL